MIVWMRTEAFPSFRKKLYRKFDHSADGFEAEEGKKNLRYADF